MTDSVPTIDDITLDELESDPYPIYARLRREAPIAWIPAANIHLVTRFDTIRHMDTHSQDFPAEDPKSLQIRAMGHTMMRKDGEAHRAERAVVQDTVSGHVIENYWVPRFEWIVDELIENIRGKGKADLFAEFAAPMAARCLIEMLGLINIRWQDLSNWSQAMMDGVANYGNDPQVWARQEHASKSIDERLDQMIEIKRINPDPSFISALANAPNISLDQIRANIKVIIGGGVNESRDATCTAVHGLLSCPEQLDYVRSQQSNEVWRDVFEETVRYCAPIGMYPRRVARDMEFEGVRLKKNAMMGLNVASACHDEKYWDDGEKFNIKRKRKQHLAFGIGPHMCLGFRTARMQVGRLSVPKLFARLPGLRFDESVKTRFSGWVFRGPVSLPVRWDV